MDRIKWMVLDHYTREAQDEFAYVSETLSHCLHTVTATSSQAEKARYRQALERAEAITSIFDVILGWHQSAGSTPPSRRRRRAKSCGVRSSLERFVRRPRPEQEDRRSHGIRVASASKGPAHAVRRRAPRGLSEDKARVMNVWIPTLDGDGSGWDRISCWSNPTRSRVSQARGATLYTWCFPPGSRVRCEWHEVRHHHETHRGRPCRLDSRFARRPTLTRGGVSRDPHVGGVVASSGGRDSVGVVFVCVGASQASVVFRLRFDERAPGVDFGGFD